MKKIGVAEQILFLLFLLRELFDEQQNQLSVDSNHPFAIEVQFHVQLNTAQVWCDCFAPLLQCKILVQRFVFILIKLQFFLGE